MKKLFLLFFLPLLPLLAHAFVGVAEIDGIYYNLVTKAKTAEVTSNPNNLYGYYSGEVVIPASVTYDGVECSVTGIGDYAFQYCSLTSITIPNSVTSIGEWAFYECRSLTSVHISDIAAWCQIAFGSYFSNPLWYGRHLFLGDMEIKDLVIPNSVVSISGSAFSGCSSLTSVTIPSSVTSIGVTAFSGCSNLTTVTIPNSVTSIGESAFEDCCSLTSVHISDIAAWCQIAFESNPLWYAHHLFIGDEEIKDLVIPNSVTSIPEYAFYGCSGLTSVTIPNSVTSIGDNAFQDCSGLTSITIVSGVTSIGNRAFYGCSGLTSITIPNSVSSIGNDAFYNCNSLTSVTIGSGVKKIYSCAFAYCPELTDVFCLAEQVPSTYSDAFEGSYIEYATLHVPAASIEAYRIRYLWNHFKEIVAIDGEIQEEEKCATPTISYKDGEISFACETENVEFVSSIKDSDIKDYTTARIPLTATYEISVYATKAGMKNSETATATLCWIDQEPKKEGMDEITTNVRQLTARAVLIKSEGGTLTIENAEEGQPVAAYTTDGRQLGTATARQGRAVIATRLQPGSIAVVKVGQKSVKVVVR